MTASPKIDLGAALVAAAREALHIDRAFDDSFLRTIGNTLIAYDLDTRREDWVPAMEKLQLALHVYARSTGDEALARMAMCIGVTHAFPSEHDHLGRRYPCGFYEHRENYSSRHAAWHVSTRPGDRVTCTGCLAATGAL